MFSSPSKSRSVLPWLICFSLTTQQEATTSEKHRNLTVNSKPFEKTYGTENAKRIVLQPFQATDTVDRFDVVAKVHGGGTSGQVDAIKHGISRALLVSDENLKPTLRGHGFLTRDSRIKERQKYGFRRARKRKQYRKR